MQAAVIQRLPDVVTAFKRHAETAHRLRDEGWRVLAHMHPKPLGA